MAITSHAPSEATQSAGSTFRAGGLAAAFSFPVMCMFLLIGAVVYLSVRAVGEPDVWWHLRNASSILEHHAIPNIDTYSTGASGAPWLDHEWLSELMLFLGFKAAGLRGLVAVYSAVLVLIFAGVYYRACRAGAECKDAALVTLLAIFLANVSIGPRPLLFGWLCLVAMLILLDRFQRDGRGIWLLPPLFALWINLHGSWVFGMIVFVLIIASGLVEGQWGLVSARRWTAGALKKIALVFLASLAALFVNPFGYKLVMYPFDLLFRQTSNLKYIQEWHPVDFSSGSGKVMMVLIFGWLAAALFSQRRWKLDEVLLMAFALWAGLSHVRLLFFTGLIAAPIFAPRLQLCPPYDPEVDKPWLNAFIMAGVVGWILFTFPSSAKLQRQLDEQFPTAALQFMQQQHVNGRIFNTDAWGGYMEWTAPELKPFTDSRADIFVYNGTFDDYVKTMLIQSPFEVLDKYKFDYVLIEPNHPLEYLLRHSPAWRPVYSDKVAVVFERAATTPVTAVN